MAVASFVAGLTEAALLVLIANIALAVGSSDNADGLAASMGPLGALDLSVRDSFIYALILTGLRAAFALWSAVLAANITSSLTLHIRAGTFTDFSVASWAEQSVRSEAGLQDLLQRHVSKTTSAVGVIAQAIGIACITVALLASAILIDPISAALLVISGAVLFVAIRPVSRIAKRFSRSQIAAGREYQTRSLEAVTTSLEVRSFGVSNTIAGELLEIATKEVEPMRRALILKQLVTSTYQTATVLLLLGGLFAVYAVLDRPLAALGAIVIILVRALNQTASLQNNYHTLTELQPFIQRLNKERAEFRISEPEPGQVIAPRSANLNMSGVQYSYDGVNPALEGISLEITHGEAIGIVGPSGSGKSTLIQLLLRLRSPKVGS